MFAFLASACGDTGADSRRDTSASPLPSVAGIASTWRSIAWEAHAGVDPQDLGVGVVFLRRAEDKAGTPGADTLVVRAAPNADAAAVGAMVFTVAMNGVVSYTVVAPDSLRPNLAEYGYEESGIPFDSTDASGRWVRGILGFGTGDSARIGWVDTQAAGVGTVRWVDELSDRPLFFPKPEQAAFFASPDSSRRVASPKGGDDDYAMHPEEVRGPWMRVRLVIPSDNCTEPDSARQSARRAWIRYLDDRGRPNVWYYTRGC